MDILVQRTPGEMWLMSVSRGVGTTPGGMSVLPEMPLRGGCVRDYVGMSELPHFHMITLVLPKCPIFAFYTIKIVTPKCPILFQEWGKSV